jgi:hypothetical protein
VSAVGGSTVVAPQGPTTDTQGFTFTQDAVPTTSRVGDTWFNTATGKSYLWFDSRWVMFAPGGGSGAVATAQLPAQPFCVVSTNNLNLPKAAVINSGSPYPWGSVFFTNDPETFEKITTPEIRIRSKKPGMYQYELQMIWNSPSATAVPMEWGKGALTTVKHVAVDAPMVTTAGAAATMPPHSFQTDEGVATHWSTLNQTTPKDYFIVGADSSAGATIWTCSCKLRITKLT